MLDLDAVFNDDRPVGVANLPDASTGITQPEDLPDDWRVEWLERAAIREFDGGQAREHAEAEALQEILDRMRTAGELT